MDDEEYRKIHEALHVLWTKAVGTPDYDKTQWMRIDNLIVDLAHKISRRLK